MSGGHAMKLDCYKTLHYAPELVPGKGQRRWMDETSDRFAYRCLPLSMANQSGWELRCPAEVTISWDGKPGKNAVKIRGYDPNVPIRALVQSHFGEGVVTFITGYLFRTPPGIGLWTSGAPNHVKHGIQALTGLIETDWLPFPFTMNWKFTAPGEVTFEKDEPFCFLTLMEHNKLESVEPQVMPLTDNSELMAEFETWSKSRADFIQSLEDEDEESVRTAWQRYYVRGESPGAARADKKLHRTKRRLQPSKQKGS